MNESEIDIREVQTVPLRRTGTEESTVIVSITEAIRAAGLGEGGSFRFDPSSVEEIGMLAAIGSTARVDGRSERFARNIYHEGAGESTLRLVIPQIALTKLTGFENFAEIDWDEPPEVNVWAGDRLLAFEMADPGERTVHIDREASSEEDETDG